MGVEKSVASTTKRNRLVFTQSHFFRYSYSYFSFFVVRCLGSLVTSGSERIDRADPSIYGPETKKNPHTHTHFVCP